MRTHDFGRAPRMARAGLMVVVGLRAGSPRGWVRQAASHRAWVTRARRSPGYRGHRAYWQPPVGVGTILWLAGPDDLAALREPPPGCWVHTLRAEPGGYTNGVWRAEDTEMAHIEHFTALTGEDQGPAARRRRRAER